MALKRNLYISWQMESMFNLGSFVSRKMTYQEMIYAAETIAIMQPFNVILMNVSLKNLEIIFSIIDKIQDMSPNSNIIVHFDTLDFSFEDFIYFLSKIKIAQFNISNFLAAKHYNIDLLFEAAQKNCSQKKILTPVAVYHIDDFFLSHPLEIVSAIAPLQLKRLNIIRGINCGKNIDRRYVFELLGEIKVEYPGLSMHYIDPMKHINSMIANNCDNQEIHIFPNGDVTVNPFTEIVMGNLLQSQLYTIYTQKLFDFWRNEGKRYYVLNE